MDTLQAFRRLLTGCALFCLLVSPCFGFALLGPYEDWMQVSNSFRLSQLGVESSYSDGDVTYIPGDIGGPMPIGSEYRWNVPVISYAFDQSFIDYFGAEGVHEIESAFKLLNKLPAASNCSPTNFPIHIIGLNYAAQFSGLRDLKSTTLSLLLEQLGLAQPTRNIVVLITTNQFYVSLYSLFQGYYRYDDQQDQRLNLAWDNLFLRRNYSPETLEPSQLINTRRYDFVYAWPVYIGGYGDTIEFPMDGLLWGYQAVTDGLPNAGYFYRGLSLEDMGGLRYLLSFTNINFEAPLPDVHRLRAFGLHKGGSDSAPPAAWRPGVEKVNFVRHPYFPKHNRSLALRRRYTDYFYENGKLRSGRVERIISQPDILFTVDNGEDTPPNQEFLYPVTRTGTTNWINNAALNGNPDGPGPGVIIPQIKFTFRRLGDQASTFFGFSEVWPPGGYSVATKGWGSFQTQGTLMARYPSQTFLRKNTGDMVIRQTRWDVGTNSWTFSHAQFWKLPIAIGGMALLQNSTDQTNWITQLTVTNNGGVTEWRCYSSNAAEVFRVVPK